LVWKNSQLFSNSILSVLIKNIKMKKMKHWLVKGSLFLALYACANDTSFSVPEILCDEKELEVTHTMEQIKAMAGFGVREFTEEMVISGYVVSSDRDGNFYKTMMLQDALENPSCALRFAIDRTEYHTIYEVGRKVFVKLKGLAIGYHFGHLTIGEARGSVLENISSFLMEQYFLKNCERGVLVPKTRHFSELNEEDTGMLLVFHEVQFHTQELEKTYANVHNTQAVEFRLQQWNLGCVGAEEIILKNSGFTSFKSQRISAKKGELTAVLEKRYDQYYLVIRNTEDVFLNQVRCEESELLTPTISMIDLQAKYDGKLLEFGVDEHFIAEGFVISSDEEGNFKNEIFLQDAAENPKAGIRVLIEKENYFETYAIGQKIRLKLNRLYLDKVDGKLTVGVYKKGTVGEISEDQLHEFLIETKEKQDLIPEKIANLAVFRPENVLVSLLDMQLSKEEKGKAFTFFSGTEEAIRFLESCGEYQKIGVFTRGTAHFSKQKFPTGNGQITGVLCKKNSLPVIQLRKLEDVSFSQKYKNCPSTNPQILITEIADPENSTGARFVELYNAGSHPVDLSGWHLKKYINGSKLAVGEGVLLKGVLDVKAFYIIAGTAFSSIFEIPVNITDSYISGNGDDVYELLDSSGARHDIYGVVGEDGSGNVWEYTDGRAIRKREIDFPGRDFEISEWEVFTKTKGTAQIAPQDFMPGFR
jgi:hypothetical protein